MIPLRICPVVRSAFVGEITPQDDTSALMQWLDDPGRIARTRITARHRVEAEFAMRDNCRTLWREYHDIVAK